MRKIIIHKWLTRHHQVHFMKQPRLDWTPTRFEENVICTGRNRRTCFWNKLVLNLSLAITVSPPALHSLNVLPSFKPKVQQYFLSCLLSFLKANFDQAMFTDLFQGHGVSTWAHWFPSDPQVSKKQNPGCSTEMVVIHSFYFHLVELSPFMSMQKCKMCLESRLR